MELDKDVLNFWQGNLSVQNQEKEQNEQMQISPVVRKKKKSQAFRNL